MQPGMCHSMSAFLSRPGLGGSIARVQNAEPKLATISQGAEPEHERDRLSPRHSRALRQ